MKFDKVKHSQSVIEEWFNFCLENQRLSEKKYISSPSDNGVLARWMSQ